MQSKFFAIVVFRHVEWSRLTISSSFANSSCVSNLVGVSVVRAIMDRFYSKLAMNRISKLLTIIRSAKNRPI